MQNNKEIEQSNTNLNDLANKFFEARQDSWNKYNRGENPKEFGALQNDYQKRLNQFFDKLKKNKISSEGDNLSLKFISMFGREFLDQNSFQEVNKILKENAKDSQILLKIDETLEIFKKHIVDFFLTSGTNFDKKSEVFYISKTDNKDADLIIETEIKRFIIHQIADLNLKKFGLNFDFSLPFSLLRRKD